uniref:Uncharacterized protein n=1 Tax=Romanomermis culicivorax TaxID=13658 RepID=A0A915KEJ0_ROMCU
MQRAGDDDHASQAKILFHKVVVLTYTNPSLKCKTNIFTFHNVDQRSDVAFTDDDAFAVDFDQIHAFHNFGDLLHIETYKKQIMEYQTNRMSFSRALTCENGYMFAKEQNSKIIAGTALAIIAVTAAVGRPPPLAVRPSPSGPPLPDGVCFRL